MPVAAAGNVSLPLSYLRASIAGSATFRTVTSASDASAALAFIFIGEVLGAADRPFALINHRGLEAFKEGSAWSRMRGVLEAVFEFPVSDALKGESKRADARMTFLNNIGAIVKEITDQFNEAGKLSVTMIRLGLQGRADPDGDQGSQYHGATFQLTYEGQWGT